MDESFYRPFVGDEVNKVEYQITTIVDRDEPIIHEDEDDDEDDMEEDYEYIVRLFGVTEDGQTISTRISGFRPYWYVEIPDFMQPTWNPRHTNHFKRWMKRKLISRNDMSSDELVDVEMEERIKIYPSNLCQ